MVSVVSLCGKIKGVHLSIKLRLVVGYRQIYHQIIALGTLGGSLRLQIKIIGLLTYLGNNAFSVFLKEF